MDGQVRIDAVMVGPDGAHYMNLGSSPVNQQQGQAQQAAPPPQAPQHQQQQNAGRLGVGQAPAPGIQPPELGSLLGSMLGIPGGMPFPLQPGDEDVEGEDSQLPVWIDIQQTGGTSGQQRSPTLTMDAQGFLGEIMGGSSGTLLRRVRDWLGRDQRRDRVESGVAAVVDIDSVAVSIRDAVIQMVQTAENELRSLLPPVSDAPESMASMLLVSSAVHLFPGAWPWVLVLRPRSSSSPLQEMCKPSIARAAHAFQRLLQPGLRELDKILQQLEELRGTLKRETDAAAAARAEVSAAVARAEQAEATLARMDAAMKRAGETAAAEAAPTSAEGAAARKARDGTERLKSLIASIKQQGDAAGPSSPAPAPVAAPTTAAPAGVPVAAAEASAAAAKPKTFAENLRASMSPASATKPTPAVSRGAAGLKPLPGRKPATAAAKVATGSDEAGPSTSTGPAPAAAPARPKLPERKRPAPAAASEGQIPSVVTSGAAGLRPGPAPGGDLLSSLLGGGGAGGGGAGGMGGLLQMAERLTNTPQMQQLMSDMEGEGEMDFGRMANRMMGALLGGGEGGQGGATAGGGLGGLLGSLLGGGAMGPGGPSGGSGPAQRRREVANWREELEPRELERWQSILRADMQAQMQMTPHEELSPAYLAGAPPQQQSRGFL